MNIDELFALTLWINQEIRGGEIVDKYNRLRKTLQQNTQAGQTKQPIAEHREDLKEALTKVPLHQLTIDQLKFLEKLGIQEHVGNTAAQRIEELLTYNVIDEATSASELESSVQAINEGLQKVDQLHNGLTGLVVASEPPKNQAVIRVYFQDKASISNVEELKNWSNAWFTIGRGVALGHNTAPQDFRVIGAGKGSFILELATTPALALTISYIVHRVLKTTEHIYDIRKKAEEVRGLKLKNDKLAQEIANEADELKESEVERITTEVIQQLEQASSVNGEKHTAIKNAVEELLTFREQGGAVDYIVPEPSEEEEKKLESTVLEELKTLRDTVQEIRLLEDSVRLLGPGEDDGAEDSDNESEDNDGDGENDDSN